MFCAFLHTKTCVSVNSDLVRITKQQQNITYGVDGP